MQLSVILSFSLLMFKFHLIFLERLSSWIVKSALAQCFFYQMISLFRVMFLILEHIASDGGDKMKI